MDDFPHPSPPQQQPPEPPLPFRVLPRRSELSSHYKQFLDQNLVTHQDLHAKAPLLLSDLTNQCCNCNTYLLNLRKNLTKLTVSWISRSFTAKSALSNLNILLENLSLLTSQYGIGSRKKGKFLVEELQKLAKQVQRIENIRKYVDTALQLEALVGDLEDAVFSIGGLDARNMFSTKRLTSLKSMNFSGKQQRLLQAIKAMNDIEEVLVNIVKFHRHWHHILESVDVRVDKTFSVLRPQVLADHRALLAALGWPPKLLASKIDNGEIAGLPNPLVLMEEDKRKHYSQTFIALCALQHVQKRREDRQHNIFGQRECGIGIWAIEELVSPLASRMEYHFSKWADHPEFMFALVYKITKDFIVGVEDLLQPLIDRARLVSCSAKEAWVSAMVQMLSGFLAKKVFPVLAEKYKEKHLRSEAASSWLHLIDQTISFDKRTQLLLSADTCLYLEESERFEGLLSSLSILTIFCDKPDWLKVWAKIELKDAWKKLKPQLKEDRAWLIDKKSGGELQIGTESKHFVLSTKEDYKAPLVAETALKITWGMIERCQTLPDVRPRVQFIRLTAAKFIWYFLNALVFRCKNTEFPLDYLDDAFIKVCGSINAARYLESKLQEWSDDVNLLEMRIAEKEFEDGKNDLDNNCFFVEEIRSMAEVMTNWLMEMITALLYHFETLSWDYLHNKRYFEREQEQEDLNLYGVSAAIDLSVSAEIVQALDTIKNQLHLLQMSLNSKDFSDLWRSVADGLDRFISCSIFASGIQFSYEGVNHFEADMQALFLVFRPLCSRPQAFFPYVKEVLKLLKMSREEAYHLQVVLSNDKKGTKCLHLCGISHLSFDQVDTILRNRKFRY